MWPCPSSKKTAHPLWTSCEGKAHRIEMATTRARMIIGRFKTQDVVSLYKGNSHPKTCQLCNEEDEDIKHMVVSCKELKQVRLDILEILQNLYHADNTPPPVSEEEVCSAVLNGWGYKRHKPNTDFSLLSTQHQIDSSNDFDFSDSFRRSFSNDFSYTTFTLHTDFIVLRNELFVKRANNLANILCHKLSKERDILLLERGSPNIGGKSS